MKNIVNLFIATLFFYSCTAPIHTLKMEPSSARGSDWENDKQIAYSEKDSVIVSLAFDGVEYKKAIFDLTIETRELVRGSHEVTQLAMQEARYNHMDEKGELQFKRNQIINELLIKDTIPPNKYTYGKIYFDIPNLAEPKSNRSMQTK